MEHFKYEMLWPREAECKKAMPGQPLYGSSLHGFLPKLLLKNACSRCHKSGNGYIRITRICYTDACADRHGPRGRKYDVSTRVTAEMSFLKS